ncbi:hypothetical protein GGR53DRAFT_261211 [Hypoxylon sp. FL1150]|nr:hypothetical protein GGR53DRAFT_261211 [Hypoxylon sp. FL1150]
MSSQQTAETYHKYKDSTSIFTAWLNEIAIACGWKPTLQTASLNEASRQERRRKTADKKKAVEVASKNGVQYNITIAELEEQIGIVAKSTSTAHAMPLHIYHALSVAIKLRTRVSTRFEITDSIDQASTKQHRHFTSVLQRAMDEIPKEKRVSPKHKGKEESVSLGNAFLALNVEHVLAEDETFEEHRAPQKEEAVRATRATRLEDISQHEDLLVARALFANLESARTYLIDLWTRYYRGETQIFQATIVTSACFEIVRRSEAVACIHSSNSNATYQDFQSIIDVAEPPNGDAHSKPVFSSAGRTLCYLAEHKDSICPPGWPAPIPKKDKSAPVPWAHLNNTQGKPAMGQDDFIRYVVLDMILDDELRQHAEVTEEDSPTASRRSFFELRDSAFAAMRDLWVRGNVTTTMVFAAQILWDLHIIPDKEVSGRMAMEFSAQEYMRRFAQGEPPTFKSNGQTYSSVPEEFDTLFKRPYHRAESELDPAAGLPLCKHRILERATKRDAEARHRGETPKPKMPKTGLPIQPDPNVTFLLDTNPLYAGTILLDVNRTAADAELMFANAHKSIYVVAHLYNFLQKTGLCSTPWAHMDRVIKLHCNYFFADYIPSSPKDMMTRLYSCMGMVPNSNPRHSRLCEIGPVLQIPLATQALGDFFRSKATLADLIRVFAAQAAIHEPVVSNDGAEKSGQNKQTAAKQEPLPSNMETLATLERHVATIIPDFDLHYVGLTRQCTQLILRMVEGLSKELGRNMADVQIMDWMVGFKIAAELFHDACLGYWRKGTAVADWLPSCRTAPIIQRILNREIENMIKHGK